MAPPESSRICQELVKIRIRKIDSPGGLAHNQGIRSRQQGGNTEGSVCRRRDPAWNRVDKSLDGKQQVGFPSHTGSGNRSFSDHFHRHHHRRILVLRSPEEAAIGRVWTAIERHNRSEKPADSKLASGSAGQRSCHQPESLALSRPPSAPGGSEAGNSEPRFSRLAGHFSERLRLSGCLYFRRARGPHFPDAGGLRGRFAPGHPKGRQRSPSQRHAVLDRHHIFRQAGPFEHVCPGARAGCHGRRTPRRSDRLPYRSPGFSLSSHPDLADAE